MTWAIWLEQKPAGDAGESGNTRRQIINNNEQADAMLPDAGPLGYLLGPLADIGCTAYQFTAGGAVAMPVSYSEIMNWPGVRFLLPCEIQTLRDMSVAAAHGANSENNLEP